MPIIQGLGARRWAWFAAAGLAVGNLFLHKSISDVCDALFARIGRGPYEHLTLLAIAAVSLGGAAALLRGHAADLRRPRIIAALQVLAVATVLAQRWLLVSNVELIHLPQFGLFAALLLAAGLDPQTAFLGASLAGVFDELYQYLVLYADVANVYLDYNDIVLNTIGAAWAVVLAGGSRAGDQAAVRWRRGLHVALLVAATSALWIAPLRVVRIAQFPYWRPALVRAATGFEYHVMSASEGMFAVLLLWGLVQLASSRSPKASLRTTRSLAAMLAIGFCAGMGVFNASAAGATNSGAVSVGAAADRRAPAPARAPLIVTFWCGPPLAELTDARAAEIAAAGFNVIGAPCEGAVSVALNQGALEIAARHRLSMWITDPRLNDIRNLPADWQAQVADAVADYADYPALGGYFLVDEPSATDFPTLGQIVAKLQDVDPHRLPYINLLPDFVPSEALGTPTYDAYLRDFFDTVHPPLLSVDYYPFRTQSDRPSFFDNLEHIRAAARAHDVPFLLIVQAMPHGPYRDPTEAELAWQVHHALAFGARGISYFAYWTPVHVRDAEKWQFRHGLVDGGEATEHLGQVARLNRDAQRYAAQLDGLRSIGIADSAGQFGAALPIGPLAGIDGPPVTVGFFVGRGSLVILIVNQDYRRAQRVALRLRPEMAAPEAFEVATGRWHELASGAVDLAAGGAQLLRWK
jgi:hypothetical protein